MQEGRPDRPPRRRVTRRTWIAVGVLFAVLLATLLSILSGLTPHVRDLAVKALNERFDSDTEIATLQVSLFPEPEVRGTGLVVRHKGRRDVAPLISVRSFSASATIPGLIFNRLHLKTVELEGLEIRVPPGGLKQSGLSLPKDGDAASGPSAPAASTPGASAPTSAPAASAASSPAASSRAASSPAASSPVASVPAVEPAVPSPPPATAPPPRPAAPNALAAKKSPIVIDTIRSRAARLQIDTDKPGKLPRIFDIHDLVMTDFGFDRAARFDARLSNPTPKGEIHVANGTFGPWNTTEPRMTPLGADYTFENADLDTIKGIGGILSSKGKFQGVLERIRVEGTTDTPDFQVDVAGQPVRLQTRFSAIVDGTNGDTWLDPVEVTLLSSSRIVARGEVVRAEDVKGRRVYLQVTIDDARIEDILRLAIKSTKMPLTGTMKLQTTFLLPAGEQDVPERLELDGAFSILQARFTSYNVQQRIDELSRRGRGIKTNTGSSVVSNLSGRFVLKDGRIRLRNLTFEVPGSAVQLAGTFDLRSEQLAFNGHLLLDASLSQMVTGYKSILVRLAQPFFRRQGGGTKLPIRVSGTPDKLSFGLDVKRALSPGN